MIAEQHNNTSQHGAAVLHYTMLQASACSCMLQTEPADHTWPM